MVAVSPGFEAFHIRKVLEHKGHQEPLRTRTKNKKNFVSIVVLSVHCAPRPSQTAARSTKHIKIDNKSSQLQFNKDFPLI